jgi:hypothetical protein
MKPNSFFLLYYAKTIFALGALCLFLQTSSCTKSDNQPVNYAGSVMLSFGGVHAAAAAGNKIFFAGGFDYSTYATTKTVDIYDVSSGIWSTTELSEARSGVVGAGIGTKIFFGGGSVNNIYSKTVDIYDVSTNSHTTAQLSEARYFLVAAAAGNKVLFAGGVDTSHSASKTVDIYDMSSDKWTTAQLSEARFILAAGAAGNKILFAGGAAAIGSSKTVDIYDVSTNTWSTSQLSEPRISLAGGGAGTKVFFAGGLANYGVSKTVDVYDVLTGTWTTTTLSEARENLTAATAGNTILFGGGNTVVWPAGGSGNIFDSATSKTVDIYNVSSSRWSTAHLSEARENPGAAGAGSKILFAGGSILDSALNTGTMNIFYKASKTVDIFTLR